MMELWDVAFELKTCAVSSGIAVRNALCTGLRPQIDVKRFDGQ